MSCNLQRSARPTDSVHVHDVIPAAELEEIAAGYKRTAGFDRQSVNSRFQALGFGQPPGLGKDDR